MKVGPDGAWPAEDDAPVAVTSLRPHAPTLIFSPHLLPVPRGIVATIYAPLAEGWDEERLRAVYEARYGDEPFVELLAPGKVATLAHANHTNRCAIGLSTAAGTLLLTSAIDNLVKGAAGQAVQNMNVMFGLEEEEALSDKPCRKLTAYRLWLMAKGWRLLRWT